MQNSFEIVTDAKHHQVQQADYEIEVIRKGRAGWYLSRKIIFSRTDLLPHRQIDLRSGRKPGHRLAL